MARKATWQQVFLSYPCPTCGAEPGEACMTTGGREAQLPHADRTRAANRCPTCGTIVNDGNPGALCARCALVRALEVERSTTWHREEPD